jgi:16S rRNA (guanine527-N7)-methyltransferase
LKSLLLKYFPELDPQQISQFEQLPGLYSFWNAQINVISRKDIEQLDERHVLHSLGIAKAIGFKDSTRIMDVGTGGGFPGIPLAIMFPHCEFLLVDSIGKKIKVVNEISKAIGLKNLRATQSRAEDVNEKFHFVVSRAVTEFPVFYGWVKNKFMKESFNELRNGLLCLKGGELEKEMGKFYNKASIYNLSDFFSEEFFETKKLVYYPVA